MRGDKGQRSNLQEDQLQREAKETMGEASAGLQADSPPSNAVRDGSAVCEPQGGPRMASGWH